MKIVQSSWVCNHKNLLAFNGGWVAPEYNIMSWALSCLQLKKYNDDVVLYADYASAKLLKDTLMLPYTEVICDLDKINNYHPQLWALPKIITYSKQTSPFLHVDGDVFIFEAFRQDLLDGNLIAQNIEVATLYYENKIEELESKLVYFPNEIVNERKNKIPIHAYNAGLFGGKDIDFFQEYTAKALEFIQRNEGCLSRIDVSSLNVFYEQYLFFVMAKNQNKKVNVFLSDEIGDNEYIGFGDFSSVPYDKKYLHLLGGYKRNLAVCKQMAERLRLDYPEFYYRIIAKFKNNNFPLKEDFYYFLKETSEEKLLMRYKLLKKNFLADKVAIENEDVIVNSQHDNDFTERTIFLINLFDKSLESPEFYQHIKNDMLHFKNALDAILCKKFNNYSKDYLYARDINQTQYLQELFELPFEESNKILLAQPYLEILQCNYNWNAVYRAVINDENVKPVLNLKPIITNIAVVPECNLLGYSLVDLDDLDLLILDILKKPKTTAKFVHEIKSHFDPVDLENSSSEFKLLISGRIKVAILSKTIKLLS